MALDYCLDQHLKLQFIASHTIPLHKWTIQIGFWFVIKANNNFRIAYKKLNELYLYRIAEKIH